MIPIHYQFQSSTFKNIEHILTLFLQPTKRPCYLYWQQKNLTTTRLVEYDKKYLQTQLKTTYVYVKYLYQLILGNANKFTSQKWQLLHSKKHIYIQNLTFSQVFFAKNFTKQQKKFIENHWIGLIFHTNIHTNFSTIY